MGREGGLADLLLINYKIFVNNLSLRNNLTSPMNIFKPEDSLTPRN